MKSVRDVTMQTTSTGYARDRAVGKGVRLVAPSVLGADCVTVIEVAPARLGRHGRADRGVPLAVWRTARRSAWSWSMGRTATRR